MSNIAVGDGGLAVNVPAAGLGAEGGEFGAPVSVIITRHGDVVALADFLLGTITHEPLAALDSVDVVQ